MPRLNAVKINALDLGSLGVATARLEGPFTPAARRWRTAPMAGRYGLRVLSANPEGASRMINLVGHVSAPSASELDAVVTRVLHHCSRGLLEVSSAHNWNKVFYCRPVDPRADPVRKQFLREHSEFSLPLECHDGLAWQALGSWVGISQNNVPRAVRVRSANVTGWFRSWGPWTNLTITILDAAGTPRLVLPLSGSAIGGHYVLIDALHGRIYRSTGGGPLVPEPNLVSATYDFPLYFDHMWGDPDRGIYPSFVVSGLGVGGGIQFLYRQTDA